jgi:hypothetical protein
MSRKYPRSHGIEGHAQANFTFGKTWVWKFGLILAIATTLLTDQFMRRPLCCSYLISEFLYKSPIWLLPLASNRKLFGYFRRLSFVILLHDQ